MPAGSQASAGSPADVPHVESLRDVRLAVAHGKYGGLAEMCDRLALAYEQRRDLALAQKNREGLVDSFMACYCRYVKAQVLALKGDFPGAGAALDDARSYRKTRSETSAKGISSVWQELEAVTSGFLLEKQHRFDDAKNAYLQAPESAIATGRLAIVELARGRNDAAKAWALPHANEPTSQFVLAEISAKLGRIAPALQDANRALGHLQKQLADGSEYMPAYFCELPALSAFRAKLQKQMPKKAPPQTKAPAAGAAPQTATPASAPPVPSSTTTPAPVAPVPKTADM